jgi:hypothetical protein
VSKIKLLIFPPKPGPLQLAILVNGNSCSTKAKVRNPQGWDHKEKKKIQFKKALATHNSLYP